MTDEDNWSKFKLLSTYDKNSLDSGYVMNNWGTFILRTQYFSRGIMEFKI